MSGDGLVEPERGVVRRERDPVEPDGTQPLPPLPVLADPLGGLVTGELLTFDTFFPVDAPEAPVPAAGGALPDGTGAAARRVPPTRSVVRATRRTARTSSAGGSSWAYDPVEIAPVASAPARTGRRSGAADRAATPGTPAAIQGATASASTPAAYDRSASAPGTPAAYGSGPAPASTPVAYGGATAPARTPTAYGNATAPARTPVAYRGAGAPARTPTAYRGATAPGRTPAAIRGSSAPARSAAVIRPAPGLSPAGRRDTTGGRASVQVRGGSAASRRQRGSGGRTAITIVVVIVVLLIYFGSAIVHFLSQLFVR